MHGDWNPGELKAALAALKDKGLDERTIADMAGRNRSAVNRWARGEHRPDPDPAVRLARRVAALGMTEEAARFMAAAGYLWDGLADEGPSVLVPPEVVRSVRASGLSREEQDRVLAAIEHELRGEPQPPPTAPGGAAAAASPEVPRRAG